MDGGVGIVVDESEECYHAEPGEKYLGEGYVVDKTVETSFVHGFLLFT